MDWISVKDRLPEEEVYILLYDDYCKEIITGELCNGNFCSYDYIMPRVTHWMPLPEPPKED